MCLRRINTSGLILAAVVFFPSIAIAKDDYVFSGFLKNYEGFQEHREYKGSLIYMKPGVTFDYLQNYKKLIIEPVEIVTSPKAKYQRLDPGARQKIANYFTRALKSEFAAPYEVVDDAGKGVIAHKAQKPGRPLASR